MTTDIELGKTNAVTPQETSNGAVIDMNDENEIDENDKIDEGKKECTVADSSIQDDEVDDDENSPLGYCRFIVKHHRLAFGMFTNFLF